MSITVLPSMASAKRFPIGVMDSSGRLFVYDSVWSLATHNYTSVGSAERYDPATGSWTTLANSIGCQQNVSFGIDSSDRFYKAGGQSVGPSFPTSPYSAACEYYDPVANSWSAIASLSNPLINTFSWMDSSGVLWVLMGRTNTTGVLNPDTNGDMSNARKYSGGPSGTWTSLSSTAVAMVNSGGPHGFGVVDSSGRGYVTSSVWQRYNTSLDTWTTLAARPAGTSAVMAITPADQVYSVGTGLRRYDIATDTWSAALATPPLDGSNGSLVYHAPTSALYLISGYSYPPGYLTSIYKYDIATNAWTNTGDVLSVGRNVVHNIVSNGVGFYIFGGINNGAFGDGTATVEYFVPSGVARPSSWVAVIG